MVSTKLTLFSTISIIVNVFNVEYGNADQIDVQTPLQFCSSERAPNPPRKELARLSEIGLGVPSSTEMDEKNTPEYHGTTSQTSPDAFLFMKYDLNKTIEENEDILKRKRR